MGALANGFQGPGAVRRHGARVRGLDRDRAGARPRERAPLPLARL